MIIQCKYDELVNVDELKPYPKNRNKHSPEQIERLSKILIYQGVRAPIVVSKLSGSIVKGHGTLEAIKKNSWLKAPIVYQDFETLEQEYAFVQSDNAIASWAELDLSGINSDLGDLGPDFDIDLLGIEDFVLEPADKEAGCDEDEVPEPKEAKTVLGDIYILGNHRLMCGDSTSIDAVEKLMDGQKADITFTSPPYNLGDNAALRGSYAKNSTDSAYRTKSDHKTQEEYLQFLKDWTVLAIKYSNLVFSNIQILAGNKFVMSEYWSTFKNNLVDLMIWDKEHAQPSAALRVLNSVFEFIFIFSDEEMPKRSIKTGSGFHGNIDNIFRLNPVGKKDKLAKDHRAVFPVAFPDFFIQKFSNESIFDPFSGSGTVLIASEKNNRKSFNMEIDPHYCDVIVSRFCKFTKTNKVIRNGEEIEWAV